VIWYLVENTLSIHSITTVGREAFYWLAVLFTFALGTAAGDLVAEQFGLGYLASALIVGAIMCALAALHYAVNLNSVFTFWAVYVLSRPLGASLGDLLSQDRDAGGLGVGATATSAMFCTIIVALVAYLTWSRVDQMRPDENEFAELGARLDQVPSRHRSTDTSCVSSTPTTTDATTPSRRWPPNSG
jgi:uncharacterized membrane-anchored protein